jgi:hypothetical protein
MSTVSNCQISLFLALPIIEAPKTPGKTSGNNVITDAFQELFTFLVGLIMRVFSLN